MAAKLLFALPLASGASCGQGIKAQLASDFHRFKTNLCIVSQHYLQNAFYKYFAIYFIFSMHHIIYISCAVTPFTNAQLQKLLELARRRNAELAITGLLLYGNERFIQVLEGEEANVQALYELIKSDPRHQYIIAYANKPIAQRTFAEWAMAFQPISPQQSAELAGYLGPTNVAIDTSGLSLIDAKLFDLLRSYALP
jgi:hypothetical protein